MINVAIVSGGYTDEKVISFKSSQLVYDSLNKEVYNPTHVHIETNGWNAIVNEKKIPIEKGDFSFIVNGKKQQFDVIYNTIHGTPGEDGILQAYWDSIEIPYTGCGFYASAITFNKKDCLAVLDKFKIPHAKSVYLFKNQAYNLDDILKEVSLPCFVKPNRSGSSLGITKVIHKDDFTNAIQLAFKEDNEILVESFLDGTEISVGVIRENDMAKVVEITEIVSENDFFDYEAKYLGKSHEITPARISAKEREATIKMMITIADILNLKGITRTDFILVNSIPHIIEVNTLPGLSPESILPQQAKYSKIPLNDLFGNEIQNALK